MKRDVLERVQTDPQVNAIVRVFGGWDEVELVNVEDLRLKEQPDPATEQEQLALTFTEKAQP